LKSITYTNYLNQLFHKNEQGNTKAQVKEIQDLLTEENKKQELIQFLIG